MLNAAVVVVMLLTAVPAFGDQSPRASQSPAPFGALRGPQQKNVYQNLFSPKQPVKTQAPTTMNDTAAKVVCGMLVIPADPTIDPKIAVPPNKASGVESRNGAADLQSRSIGRPAC